MLVSCGPSEEEIEARITQESEQRAIELADEIAQEYITQFNENRLTPLSVSEMQETIGRPYTQVRESIREFNQAVVSLQTDNTSVYDLNRSVSEYLIGLRNFEDADTERLSDDYITFYNEFRGAATDYIEHVENLISDIQGDNLDNIDTHATGVAESIERLYDAEYLVFGTPLGDVMLSDAAKDRAMNRLTELCETRVDRDNSDYLDEIALPEVDKSSMNTEELEARQQAESEYEILLSAYRENVSQERQTCRQNVLSERRLYGERLVPSEHYELEAELRDILYNIQSTVPETDDSVEDSAEAEGLDDIDFDDIEWEDSSSE